jgi:hypothetical protein
MSLEIRAPWCPLVKETCADISTSTGVYEIAAPSGRILVRGIAGGRTTFGLRGELSRQRSILEGPLVYRVEVNSNYMSRLRELDRFAGEVNVEPPTRPTEATVDAPLISH